MKAKEFIQQMHSLIENGDLPQVIDSLKKLFKGSKKLDELILHSARYNSIMEKIRMGTLDYENSTVAINQLTVALIHMVNTLENEALPNQELSSEIERITEGSNFSAEKIRSKKDVQIKIDQKNSNVKLSDLESKEGKINIDISQE
ncbi:MAG: hypothetical protein AB3N14_02980 [Flavobacteriaceae bacterium]